MGDYVWLVLLILATAGAGLLIHRVLDGVLRRLREIGYLKAILSILTFTAAAWATVVLIDSFQDFIAYGVLVVAVQCLVLIWEMSRPTGGSHRK